MCSAHFNHVTRRSKGVTYGREFNDFETWEVSLVRPGYKPDKKTKSPKAPTTPSPPCKWLYRFLITDVTPPNLKGRHPLPYALPSNSVTSEAGTETPKIFQTWAFLGLLCDGNFLLRIDASTCLVPRTTRVREGCVDAIGLHLLRIFRKFFRPNK